MIMHSQTAGWDPSWKPFGFLFASFILFFLFAALEARGFEIDGFTEPHRTINVASGETGIINTIHVHEGRTVQQGEMLAELDQDVHLALMAIAEQSMNETGRLRAAQAEVDLRRARLNKFEQLRNAGHARQEEVERARMDLAVGEGQLTAVREDLLIKKLDYDKIVTQLERRGVRSPVGGVISEIYKEVGEFVAPNSPEVLVIVQLDPLVATFSVPSTQAGQLRVGDPLDIRFAEIGQVATGTISFIAPTTDAESGTVQVKVRIENPDGQYRSGERCTVKFADPKR